MNHGFGFAQKWGIHRITGIHMYTLIINHVDRVNSDQPLDFRVAPAGHHHSRLISSFLSSHHCWLLSSPFQNVWVFKFCKNTSQSDLSGWWFQAFLMFPYIGNVIIPTDFHIFQRGRSTTNQLPSGKLT